jgi:hypothetical protein
MDNTLKAELKSEAQRIEEDALFSGKGHYIAVARWRWSHRVLGVVSAAASALAAISVLMQWTPTVAVTAAAAATLAAVVLTALKPSEQADRHQRAGDRYFEIKNSARIFREIELIDPNASLKDLIKGVKLMSVGLAGIRSGAPTIPRHAYKRAKREIEIEEGADFRVAKVQGPAGALEQPWNVEPPDLRADVQSTLEEQMGSEEPLRWIRKGGTTSSMESSGTPISPRRIGLSNGVPTKGQPELSDLQPSMLIAISRGNPPRQARSLSRQDLVGMHVEVAGAVMSIDDVGGNYAAIGFRNDADKVYISAHFAKPVSEELMGLNRGDRIKVSGEVFNVGEEIVVLDHCELIGRGGDKEADSLVHASEQKWYQTWWGILILGLAAGALVACAFYLFSGFETP